MPDEPDGFELKRWLERNEQRIDKAVAASEFNREVRRIDDRLQANADAIAHEIIERKSAVTTLQAGLDRITARGWWFLGAVVIPTAALVTVWLRG